MGSTCTWFYYTNKACLAFHWANMNNYHRWAAYVAGTILVLMTELGVQFEDSISMLVPPVLNLCYWYFILVNNKISYWMLIEFPKGVDNIFANDFHIQLISGWEYLASFSAMLKQLPWPIIVSLTLSPYLFYILRRMHCKQICRFHLQFQKGKVYHLLPLWR